MWTLLCAIAILLIVPFSNATQVRLSDTAGTGRVEIYYQGEWMTVYSYYFNNKDAQVICNMLGFNNSGITYQYPSPVKVFGKGTGSVITQQFNCKGNETDLSSCGTTSHWSIDTTPSHDNDIAISCEPTKLRLVDGDTTLSGRVEFHLKGTWYTICDGGYYFDDADARVICGMLGHTNTGIAQAYKSSVFGQASTPSMLSGLTCGGDEKDIKLCSSLSWGPTSSSCNHRQDAGVNCGSTPIRLVGGPNNSSGRIEIKHGGAWGTVCGSSSGTFDQRNVLVICKMLGFQNTNVFGYPYAYYGEGNGQVITSSLNCDGSESDINSCTAHSWIDGTSTSSILCSHEYDVGVNCAGKTQIRLADGISEQSGRLEIYHNGHWGSVEGSYFDNHALAVVCKMLGYEYHNSRSFFKTKSFFGSGVGEIVAKNIKCNGAEKDIGQCSGDWWPRTKSESHDNDVGVSCDGIMPLRLVGGVTNSSGRVEILHNGQYGTICNRKFDRYDLIVVCRMMGFENIPNNAYWHTEAYFGQGLGEIVVSDLNCNGIEISIGHCGGTWPAYSCDHGDDVAVSCDGVTEKLRLVGGKDEYSGRVELFHGNQWGTICADNFDRADAAVICRMIGIQNPGNAIAYKFDHFGYSNSSLVVASSLHCNGLEENLEQCKPSWLPSSCYSGYGSAGVDCKPSGGSIIVG